MDVGMTKFETTTKVITLMDAPGHKDFIPNMITGAAQVPDISLMIVHYMYIKFPDAEVIILGYNV